MPIWQMEAMPRLGDSWPENFFEKNCFGAEQGLGSGVSTARRA
jgi:hypothetical protein